ncbi:peptidoglycan-binding protein [Streptomyces sp. NPDC093970]|uniref:peptidoglycan-binding domain-containing protein n=1 Tax=Streptomyces sp. NPDC093970 TaxID=3155076 RepID=UPI0034441B07
MTETTGGHRCPECGEPRGADNTPSCDCTRRASDALRDARTAEQAAAEDFDPLRIRPYVDLPGGGPEADAAGGRSAPSPVVAAATVPLRALPGTDVPGREAPAAEVPEPEAPEPEVPEPEVPPRDPPRARRRVPRWVLPVSIAGAVAGVLATATLAGGLFSHVTPERDTAAPGDVRASVPDVTPGKGSASATAPVTSAAAKAPAVPSAPAATSASPTASPSRTVSASPSATASRRATPTRSATTTGTAASAQPTSAPVLGPGDSGPEVTELQSRLAQLRLFTGTADGHYGGTTEAAVRTYQLARGILTDPSGVYGAATRAALEAETAEP